MIKSATMKNATEFITWTRRKVSAAVVPSDIMRWAFSQPLEAHGNSKNPQRTNKKQKPSINWKLDFSLSAP